MNWPDPTARTAFLAGVWAGAVGVTHVVLGDSVGGFSAERGGSFLWVSMLIAIVPVYPYVIGMKGMGAKMSRLPTAEDFVDTFRWLKRVPFWMLGFPMPFLLLWLAAVILDVANW